MMAKRYLDVPDGSLAIQLDHGGRPPALRLHRRQLADRGVVGLGLVEEELAVDVVEIAPVVGSVDLLQLLASVQLVARMDFVEELPQLLKVQLPEPRPHKKKPTTTCSRTRCYCGLPRRRTRCSTGCEPALRTTRPVPLHPHGTPTTC